MDGIRSFENVERLPPQDFPLVRAQARGPSTGSS